MGVHKKCLTKVLLMSTHNIYRAGENYPRIIIQGPVVQSVVSLTSLLRVISLTVLANSIHNILIFFAEKTFFSKKFQHICVSLDVNFKELLTNDVVSFEQLGPVCYLNKSSVIIIKCLHNLFKTNSISRSTYNTSAKITKSLWTQGLYV